VRAVLASIVPGVADLGPRDDVRKAPGWDSLAALRAVVELERVLGMPLPHDLFTRVHTIDALERALRGEATP
jgi:acyl carrier protein